MYNLYHIPADRVWWNAIQIVFGPLFAQINTGADNYDPLINANCNFLRWFLQLLLQTFCKHFQMQVIIPAHLTPTSDLWTLPTKLTFSFIEHFLPSFTIINFQSGMNDVWLHQSQKKFNFYIRLSFNFRWNKRCQRKKHTIWA